MLSEIAPESGNFDLKFERFLKHRFTADTGFTLTWEKCQENEGEGAWMV